MTKTDQLISQIDKAIISHGLWRDRLTNAIETKKFEVSVEDMSKDDVCEFGAWLHEGEMKKKYKNNKHYKEVIKLHAHVHKHAAVVLDLILKGKKDEAKKMLDVGSECVKQSSALVFALLKWKEAEGDKSLLSNQYIGL